ncbi:tim-barrel domain-containing protein [Xylariaceae sp. FL0255]|nr:tim-barrel domain-containing protein [Xylariaceae sp. FL0255]
MFLNPLDPLFAELQDKFITKQKSYYGNVTNFYTLDQFNENSPASGDLDYLESISSNTWKSLKAASADAIWVMQGWLFSSNSAFWTNEKVEAFLGGVTVDSDMLILDLFSESQPQWQRTSSFYGKPWIWCELHGYGGNYGLYGQIMNITENSIAAVDNSSNSIVGFGLTMEGLEGNEIMYDLLLDQAWSETPIDTETYFYDWVSVRYGASGTHLSSDVFDAWELLRPTVFTSAVPKSIFELLPSTTGLLVSSLQVIFELCFESKLTLLQFIPVYEELIALYNQTSSSAGAVQNQGKKLIALLSTLDLVLDTNEHFRLGSWVEAARATTDSSHADFLEYGDYASKSWSGLVKTYYIPRWQKFIDYLVATPPSSYNQTSFNVDLLAWELTWVNQTTGDSATPSSRDTLQAVLATAIRSWESIFSA